MARTRDELLQDWRTEMDMDRRDSILKEMEERGLFPHEDEKTVEDEAGLYPDIDDPLFLPKLLRKQEFAENKQRSLVEQVDMEDSDPCDPTKEFELSPVQRFIGQFLSPKTPYNSALLYHGVGVGKTCSAITVAEAFLEEYPRKKVIIVAPPNIQAGFERTIFNEAQLKLGTREGQPNEFRGCTGNTYLRLTATEYLRDSKLIGLRVARLRAKRYSLFGYTQFYNHIRSILDRRVSKQLKGERLFQEEMKELRKVFSGTLLIIDEAHNLRDIAGETPEENEDAPGGTMELTESQAGKKLTPYLKRILQASDGLKLLLLTATPMYNTYREIIFLFNLLLLNDKKTALLKEEDIFTSQGQITDQGEKLLGKVASSYLSFMRGENPISFPIRLFPEGVPKITEWPDLSPQNTEISAMEREQIVKFPFVPCPSTENYEVLSEQILGQSGLSLSARDTLIQAGNWMYPSSSEDLRSRIGEQGFGNCFQEEAKGGLRVYRSRAGVDVSWMLASSIGSSSPKTKFLLDRLQTTKGVSFVYSRYVKTGALSIALALEANGYTLFGRDAPFLLDGNKNPNGRQCAFCSFQEKNHTPHAFEPTGFAPAKYVLLTGREEISPNNKLSVDTARSDANKDGRLVKVILGSQVASEGIDLRFVRECFVFDSWYHLSKLEQVIGRAIRMCSHVLLPKEERNCTINLLVSTFPEGSNKESVDMYQYRIGFQKAQQVGRVTRLLKRYALDCNLNRNAIVIDEMLPEIQVDAQGHPPRTVDINDMPYTSVCDWIETCDYKCAEPILDDGEKEAVRKLDFSTIDDGTYDEYASKWREHMIKDMLKRLFERRDPSQPGRITGQPFLRLENILEAAAVQGIPKMALLAILYEIVGSRAFRIHVGNQDGYIIYKNGLYIFQPESLRDQTLPIALRMAAFPVKRDNYDPKIEPIPSRVPVVPMGPNAAEVGGPRAVAPAAAVAEESQMEVDERVSEFWTACLNWVEAIEAGGPMADIPNPMKDAIRRRYGSIAKRMQRVFDSIGMVLWCYRYLKDSAEKRKIYALVVAEFLWDELLNVREQLAIYEERHSAPTPLMEKVWKENVVKSGSSIAFRYVNPNTGKLDYICQGKPCIPSLIKVFEDEPSDELRNLIANTTTTALNYGTVNFKRGAFVFKSNVPVSPEKKKPDLGSECANVSNISAHYKLLEEIGQKIKTTLGTDFDLTYHEMAESPRSFQNSVRACTLTDLVLRYVDKERVSGKRWFYRPVATFKSNHKGLLQKAIPA
jgi:hypothetical protein